MFEKVNPQHPDKIADRIAGAIVDLAYSKKINPKVACEVLIGHDHCYIVNETDTHLTNEEIAQIVNRIKGTDKPIRIEYLEVPQDPKLAHNQEEEFRCGDNGIFKGCPITNEQAELIRIARQTYEDYPTDGKYLIVDGKCVICQSGCPQATTDQFIVNPIGTWEGGIDVDTGATNRKLGSDLGNANTGGGLHGKDLSKADVSITVFLHMLAREDCKEHTAHCSIGDTMVEIDGSPLPFSQIVVVARQYILYRLGGFEKMAEWGLLR